MYMYSVCVCVHAYSVVNNLADFLLPNFIIHYSSSCKDHEATLFIVNTLYFV